jgi:hypothetical protein
MSIKGTPTRENQGNHISTTSTIKGIYVFSHLAEYTSNYTINRHFFYKKSIFWSVLDYPLRHVLYSALIATTTAFGENSCVLVEFCQIYPCTPKNKHKKRLFVFYSPPQLFSNQSPLQRHTHIILRSTLHLLFITPRPLGSHLLSRLFSRAILMEFQSQKSQKSLRRFHTGNNT